MLYPAGGVTLTLATVDGQLLTDCHRVWPWGRSPFTPVHRTIPFLGVNGADPVTPGNGWRAVTTVAELDALRSWGPWAALKCHLCNRSLTL